jgi:hypothetical protein
MEIVRKLSQLLLLAVMSIAAAEVNRNYSSLLKDTVTSLNSLLDYMLEPRSVVGDLIFGVVLARGEFCSCVLLLSISSRETIPLQPWTGPESSRSLRLSDFKTIVA